MAVNSVLILEHNDVLSNIFSFFIEKRNLQNSYRIIKTATSNEALDIIRKEKFELILVDHDFIESAGVQFLTDMSGNCNGAKCILVSDNVNNKQLEDRIKDGSLSQLNRSFQEAELLAVLNKSKKDFTTSSLTKVFAEIDESSFEAVFIDKDFTIIYANKQFREVHGENIGNQCYRVMGMRDHQCETCPAHSVFEKKSTKSIIRKFINENQQQKELKEIVKPNITDDNKVQGFLLTFSDAMTADIMPEPILQHLAKIQSLEEQNLIVFSLDKDSRIVYADENFAGICESDSASMIGKPITDFLHSYLVEYLVKEQTSFVKFVKSSIPRHINIDFLTRKSKQRCTVICEFRSTPDLAALGWDVMVTGRDAQKEKILTKLIEFLEESSRQLLSGNFDMFMALDQEKNIKSINESCANRLGCRKDKLLGVNIDQILAEERDKENLVKAFAQVSAFNIVYNLRIDLKYKNKLIPTLVNVRSVQDRFNNDIGFVLVMRDIEKDLLMEATLPRIERMQALGELAATTAHQINNYLDGISKGIALLEMDVMMGQVSESFRNEFSDHLTMVRERTSRLAALTKHLTNYARSQQAPVISLGDVNLVIKDVVELVKDKIMARVAVIRTNLSKTLPPVYFSPLHLEQAIINMVMNAHDALPEKDGRIGISTSVKEDWVCIAIKDNGCGIPDEIKPDLFKAFTTTKPVGIGTGLGLKLAKDVIKSFNGKIDVDSKVGVGTTFTISLPIRTTTGS